MAIGIYPQRGGYDPVFFWGVSFVMGLFGLMMGLLILLASGKFTLSNWDLYFMAFCSMLTQTVVFLPDYYGRLFQIDMRTPEGQDILWKIVKMMWMLMIPVLVIVKFILR